MTYKLSPAICSKFNLAAGIGDDEIPPTMSRLGIEQIQDCPGFPDAARARWELTDLSQAQPIPEEALNMYRMVNRATSTVTIDQVSEGLEGIIYDQEFIDSCTERWAACGEGNGGPNPKGIVEVDLGAMPHPDDLVA